MANRFVRFLDTVGHDFNVGLEKILPFVKEATQVAASVAPAVAVIDPGIGAIFATTVATVSEVEQKFAALGQQTGSGPAKLAQAMTILEPVITEAFQKAGKASDVQTVENYVNAVVALLNAIPANGTGTAPAAPPAATSA